MFKKNLTQEQGLMEYEGNRYMTNIQMIMVCIVIFTLEAILLFGLHQRKGV